MYVHPLKEHREWLRVFWNKCGREGHKWHYSSVDKDETIEMLVLLGTVTISYKNSKWPLDKKRAKFDKVKNVRHRFKSHKQCFACGGPGQCRHHIIWLKNGGINAKKNIVTLCNVCHAEVHPWLKYQQRA